MALVEALGDQHLDGLADELAGGVPEHLAQQLVDVGDHAHVVDDHDPVGSGVEDVQGVRGAVRSRLTVGRAHS